MLELIHFLNTLPPALLWVIQLVVCYTSVLVMMRFFGKHGLYVFMAIIVITANIQVLKVVDFSFFPNPVALGTVLFTSAFLATDILTEYYGAQAARIGVMLAFAGMILILINMTIALGFKPLTHTQAIQDHLVHTADIQTHMLALFSPTPALLSASIISFLISQFSDIWIFRRIRGMTGSRWLWLRNNASTIVAAFLDNVIFNLLAWRVFAHFDMSWHALIYSYILGTFFIRVLISILDTPFIYIAKYMLPKQQRITA